jgi:hypothetical protein
MYNQYVGRAFCQRGGNMLKKALLFFLIMLALPGCSKSAENLTPAALTGTAPAATQAAIPFPTIPPLTPSSSSSPTPFISFAVKPAVDNLKLRLNPGFLFDALRMVHQTDTLTVLGKAPGGEWIYVQAADNAEGWVFTQLLTSTVDLKQVPVREPKDVIQIKGRVLDASGVPIPGVGFVISQGATPDSTSNNISNTDANGDFYSFIPANSTGVWSATYNGIACDSTVWADSTCTNYKSGYTGVVIPGTLTVNLPQAGSLAFTWK